MRFAEWAAQAISSNAPAEDVSSFCRTTRASISGSHFGQAEASGASAARPTASV